MNRAKNLVNLWNRELKYFQMFLLKLNYLNNENARYNIEIQDNIQDK